MEGGDVTRFSRDVKSVRPARRRAPPAALHVVRPPPRGCWPCSMATCRRRRLGARRPPLGVGAQPNARCWPMARSAAAGPGAWRADFVGRIAAMNRYHPEATRASTCSGSMPSATGPPGAGRTCRGPARCRSTATTHCSSSAARCIGDAAAFIGEGTATRAIAYDDLVPFARQRLVLDGTAAVCYGPVGTRLI